MKVAAQNVGVARYISDDPFTMLKMGRYGTSFNLDGIWGGNMYAGGAGAVLPDKITSKHNIRYVPNMDGLDLVKKIRAQLDRNGYKDVDLKIIGDVPWAKMSYDTDIARALESTYDIFHIPYGKKGSNPSILGPYWPAYLFGNGPVGQRIAPVEMPIIGGGAGMGGRAHAANEYLRHRGGGQGVRHGGRREVGRHGAVRVRRQAEAGAGRDDDQAIAIRRGPRDTGATSMSPYTGIRIAFRALGRNKLETGLAMLGMTIGVGAVLTTMALGNGAQASIEQQVMAAGLNVIVVTAGNYQTKQGEELGGVVAHQGDARPRAPLPPGVPNPYPDDPVAGPMVPPTGAPARPALWHGPRPAVQLAFFHPEDNPMEKHDHPTAAQRLGDAEAGLGSAATLTRQDAEAIRDLGGVQYVATGVHDNAHVESGSKRWFTRYHGTDLDLPRIHRSWSFTHGRFFNQGELDRAQEVMVLGSVVSQRLFGPDVNPVGRTVLLWKQPFTVVGVVASTSWTTSPRPGDDQFDAVYVPVTTVDRLLDLSKLNTITITVTSSGQVTRVAKEIARLLRVRHKITEKMPDDFTVTTQARAALTKGLNPRVAQVLAGNVSNFDQVTLEQLARTLQRASRTMTALLASIASVSLLVGGIGIMNIMLLSVTERTHEIGVRMAVGARARDVLWQFVAEAVALSLVGGLTGVIVGFAASDGLSRFLHWSTIVSTDAVAISFGIAAVVGIFFGLYPARQASRQDPIDALRYE